LGVDALVWNLPWDLVCPYGMFKGAFAEAEEGADEGQGYRHAEPESQKGHQSEERNGSRGSLVPKDQVHDEEVGEDDAVERVTNKRP